MTVSVTTPAALQCRECGQQYAGRAAHDLRGVLRAARAHVRPAVDRRRGVPQAGRGRAAHALAVRAAPPRRSRVSTASTSARGSRRSGGQTTWPRASASSTLWIKDDSVNPSNSFKDRVVSIAITMARAFGFEAVSCASTGNLANATAAHAAKAGMACYVFVPDDLERAKILSTEAYGAKVVAVEGQLRRREPPVLRGRRRAAVGVREREHAAVLRGGLEVAGVRDRGAARVAAARPCRRADRVRGAAHEDPPGVQRADRDRRRRREALPRVGGAGGGMLARRRRRSPSGVRRGDDR